MINEELTEWLKGKKIAILLRKSEGDKGSTKLQLERIKKDIIRLEDKTGLKINRAIVGKDIHNKKKYSAKDLLKVGDIYNEGEGSSGFKTDERPVLVHLLEKVKEGVYDGVAMESFDRLSRDILGLAYFALPLWREDGKVFIGFNGDYLNKDRENEYLNTIVSAASSLAKVGEIKKGQEALFGGTVSRGFLKGSKPSFIGTGRKDAGIDYRGAYALMKAYGENKNGYPNSVKAIATKYGKTNRWVYDWYEKMKELEILGALDDFLESYDIFNNYILSLGGYPKSKWDNDEGVKRIKYATAGYFAYPAGVKIETTNEWVKFPSLNKLSLEELISTNDASTLQNFNVERKPYDGKALLKVQTQHRSRAGESR
jgi:DNA invertase Pin-like site-specific DNA recombinase